MTLCECVMLLIFNNERSTDKITNILAMKEVVQTSNTADIHILKVLQSIALCSDLKVVDFWWSTETTWDWWNPCRPPSIPALQLCPRGTGQQVPITGSTISQQLGRGSSVSQWFGAKVQVLRRHLSPDVTWKKHPALKSHAELEYSAKSIIALSLLLWLWTDLVMMS